MGRLSGSVRGRRLSVGGLGDGAARDLFGCEMPENEGEELSSLADMAALTTHFEALRSRLLGMLRRRIDPVLAPRLDAEDLLNEVYLVARRRWGRFASSGMSP